MKPKNNILFLVLLAVAAGRVPSVRAAQIPVDGYAAIVDDQVITIGEVIQKVTPWEERVRRDYTGEELTRRLEKLYDEGLEVLIEEKLILQNFKKEQGTIPDKLIEEQIQKTILVEFSGDRNAFLKSLEEKLRMNLEEYRKKIRDDLTVMIQTRREVYDKVQVSPSQVRSEYENRKEELRKPEEVHLYLIALSPGETPDERAEQREKARVLANRLGAGEPFETLARKFSEDSRAENGGDYGWVKPKDYRKELREAMDGLEPGAVSGVVETEDLLYIVKVSERKEGGAPSFESLKGDLEEYLRQTQIKRVRKDWIEKLKRSHYIKIYTNP